GIPLLEAGAAQGERDVIAKGSKNGEAGGWVGLANGKFQSDRAAEPPVSDGALRGVATAAGQTVTFSCVPPGSGIRLGVDRDGDGFFDRDELDDGTDPADPNSFPGSAPVLVPTKSIELKDSSIVSQRKVSFQSPTKGAPETQRIHPPPASSIGNPIVGGATLTVYNSAGLTNDVDVVHLPPAGWSQLGGTTLKGWRFKSKTGPIMSVIVKQDSITVKGGKDGWMYTLDESAQGRVAVRLRLGDLAGWCADDGALAKGNPPSTANFDHPDLFKGAPRAPAPQVC